MSNYQHEVLGVFTGRVGNQVGYYRNGKYHIRSAPGKKEKQKRLSGLDRINRPKFKLAAAILKPMSDLIRLTFRDDSGIETGMDMAMSHTLSRVISGFTNLKVDWSKLLVSHGKLYMADSVKAIAKPGKVMFSWKTEYSEGGNPRDMAVLVVYAPYLLKCIYHIGPIRDERKVTIECPRL